MLATGIQRTFRKHPEPILSEHRSSKRTPLYQSALLKHTNIISSKKVRGTVEDWSSNDWRSLPLDLPREIILKVWGIYSLLMRRPGARQRSGNGDPPPSTLNRPFVVNRSRKSHRRLYLHGCRCLSWLCWIRDGLSYSSLSGGSIPPTTIVCSTTDVNPMVPETEAKWCSLPRKWIKG